MSDQMTFEVARKLAEQDSPLPSLASAALKFLIARFDALDLGLQSVCRVLEKHGVQDVDDPGEAIEVLLSSVSATDADALKPSFEVFQTWAMANGCGSLTDDEAWSEWEKAHPVLTGAIRDKARLDSGEIILTTRDDFGEMTPRHFSGFDLRTAIDAGIASASKVSIDGG